MEFIPEWARKIHAGLSSATADCPFVSPSPRQNANSRFRHCCYGGEDQRRRVINCRSLGERLSARHLNFKFLFLDATSMLTDAFLARVQVSFDLTEGLLMDMLTLTFSNSKRWNRSTWIACTIWKEREKKKENLLFVDIKTASRGGSRNAAQRHSRDVSAISSWLSGMEHSISMLRVC
jgi:hypothetical protein